MPPIPPFTGTKNNHWQLVKSSPIIFMIRVKTRLLLTFTYSKTFKTSKKTSVFLKSRKGPQSFIFSILCVPILGGSTYVKFHLRDQMRELTIPANLDDPHPLMVNLKDHPCIPCTLRDHLTLQ